VLLNFSENNFCDMTDIKSESEIWSI